MLHSDAPHIHTAILLLEAATLRACRTLHLAPQLHLSCTSAAPQVAEIAKPEFKARMAVKLAVAGAFHTDFMKPAVPALEAVLKEVRRSADVGRCRGDVGEM